MCLLGENNLWILWLGKTLNAWISLHIEQVTFDGLPNGPMSDLLTLTHLVQVEISVVAQRSHLVRW